MIKSKILVLTWIPGFSDLQTFVSKWILNSSTEINWRPLKLHRPQIEFIVSLTVEGGLPGGPQRHPFPGTHSCPGVEAESESE